MSPNSKRDNITFIVLMVISLIILIFNPQKIKSVIAAVVDTISYPIVALSDYSINFIYETVISVENMASCAQKLTECHKLNQNQTESSEKTKFLESRIAYLEEQLAYKRFIDLKASEMGGNIPAEIVSFGPSNYYKVIIINKGSRDGISLDMPVIGYQDGVCGVIGKVTDVNMMYSRVSALNETSIKIGCMVLSTREHGLVEGMGISDPLVKITYLDKNADIKINDTIVTSGEGSIFPKDILIGYVEKVIVDNINRAKEAYVKPYINLARLEYVFILKRLPPEDLRKLTQNAEQR